MNISILLPYKENFSPEYAGAVSIFINAITKKSLFKNDITIFGSTKYKVKLSKNYVNIPLSKKLLKSQSKDYVEKFKLFNNKKNADILEIHNRPNYIKHLFSLKTKLILYFHNDPLTMDGSRKIQERILLIDECEKIVFNSEWSKKQFLKKLPKFYYKSKKLIVIHQSVNQKKIDFKKKKDYYVCR